MPTHCSRSSDAVVTEDGWVVETAQGIGEGRQTNLNPRKTRFAPKAEKALDTALARCHTAPDRRALVRRPSPALQPRLRCAGHGSDSRTL